MDIPFVPIKAMSPASPSGATSPTGAVQDGSLTRPPALMTNAVKAPEGVQENTSGIPLSADGGA